MANKAMTIDACTKTLMAIMESKAIDDTIANMGALDINGMPVFAYMEGDPHTALPRVLANYYLAKDFGWKAFMIVVNEDGTWELFESTKAAIKELCTGVFHMPLQKLAA